MKKKPRFTVRMLPPSKCSLSKAASLKRVLVFGAEASQTLSVPFHSTSLILPLDSGTTDDLPNRYLLDATDT